MHIIATFTRVYQLQNNDRQQNICIIIIDKKRNAGHYGNLLLEQIILKVLSKGQILFYCWTKINTQSSNLLRQRD